VDHTGSTSRLLSSVSLGSLELVDDGLGEHTGGNLLLEQDVEFGVSSTLGLGQSEVDYGKR
jgi:hypothetical protein